MLTIANPLRLIKYIEVSGIETWCEGMGARTCQLCSPMQGRHLSVTT
jgi:hypothetical protein